jgi:sec-independent protein translocase protein TatA
MGVPSGMELFIIVAIVVLLFGGKKIPELASGLGKGIKNFKNAVKEDEPTVAKTNDEKIDNTASTTETTTTAEAPKTETTNTTENKTV